MVSRALATPGLVGREQEVEAILAGLEGAAAGRGRLFLVAGEPGIGKSRLADEAASRASERGFQVAWGRCWEAGGAPAYWPWVQSLRSYVRGLGPEDLRAQLGAGAPFVAQVVAEVVDALPDIPPPPPMEAEAGRFRFFDSVATFLHNAGDRQPLMLVLDDLHAADTPSLLLLQFVARELGESRALVLGAYRDLELDRDHPLTFCLAELSRQRTTTHLQLSGLSEPEVASMIESTAGVAPSESVAVAVHRGTEGNPLFVSEVIRLLMAEGGLERIHDPGALRPAIPEGVREVIGRRVGRLSQECASTLALASVFGREFSLEAVAIVLERPPGEVLEVLDEAVAARLVAEVPGASRRLRFGHALVRDTLYEAIGAGRRAGLHRQAGESLEALYQPRLEPHLAELAHHFFEAAPGGQPGKAVGYAEGAAQRALAALAYEEAVRLFRMALAALDLGNSPDEQARCRLLLALGDALDRAGDRQAARDELLRAADIARQEGMAEELGQAALAYAGRFIHEHGAADRRTIPLLDEARAALRDKGGPLRARALARLAAAMRDQVDRRPRDELSREALELARSLDDPSTLAYVLASRWVAVIGPDDPEGLLAIGEELRAVARKGQDKEREIEAEACRFVVLLELGRPAEAREAVEAMGRLADELRQPAQRWFATAGKANLALLEGRFSDAEALIGSALRFGERSHPFEAVAYSRVQLFMLCSEDGRLAEMEPEIRRSVQEYPTRPLFRCLLASLLTELRDMGRAREVFEAVAAKGFSEIPLNNDFLLSLTRLVEVAVSLADAGRAAVFYELLLPYQGLVVDTYEWSTGAVDRYLGLAAMTAGEPGKALRHLQDALELNTRIGAHPWAARTQRDLARVLVARDGPGDRDSAADLLRAALGTAERLGMSATADRVREDLRPHVQAATAGPQAATGAPTRGVFRREGEYWSVALGGEAFRLKDTKGLHYLSHLLQNAGRELHVLDLVTMEEGGAPARPARPARSEGLKSEGFSDAGPMLDERAKSAYRARLRELEDDLDEASAWADPARAARARHEMDFLVAELATAVGLGGRDRKTGSQAERARVNITRAIRSALARVRQHSGAVADHLDATIRTGVFCSYAPDPRSPVTWHG